MKFAQDIIIKPIITEKSMIATHQRKYTFKVAQGVCKQEIAKAVEELFGITVEKVNTVSVRGKKRRYGRHEGYRPSWKKAIVTATEDSKTIEFFESMM